MKNMLLHMRLILLGLPGLVAVHGAAIEPHIIGQASLPQYSNDTAGRAAAIATKAEGWLYGPPLLNLSYFPTGTRGDARVRADLEYFSVDRAYIESKLIADLPLASNAISANGGLKTIDDYANVLYGPGQWDNSVPGGESPGILTNYTQDLLFSMERLSLNPYPLQRVGVNDPLLFELDDIYVTQLSGGTSWSELRASGRLFFVDHSYQAKYPANPGRFGAPCSAFFFIHPLSEEFLPLAIKTNTGSNLVYTPLDSPNDWLLAKLLFNSADLFHSQIFHLTASHAVGEPVHQAAERTLSDEHPIMVLLERLMVGAYAVRPIGGQVLFNPGGLFDGSFFLNNTAVRQFAVDFYPSTGKYQGNYLDTDLAARGLIWYDTHHKTHSHFKSFPFYEDAKAIRNNIKAFMTSFVDSYYKSDRDYIDDSELQDFFKEACTVAKVIDFPSSDSTPVNRYTVINVLTHFAWLTGGAHHALNTGDLAAVQGTLPFHPTALYAPVPTTKGVPDIMPFLPPVPAAVFQANLMASFNRAQYASQNRTLADAYSDSSFLSHFNQEVVMAAETYKSAMLALSSKIKSRTFDAEGLSQGMPFVWRSLDPGTIPWFFCV